MAKTRGGPGSRFKFLTDPDVMKRIDRGTAIALGKWGAYVRQTARQSMRRRKKPAPPGMPPSVHEGSVKRLVHFYYDLKTDTVVVGPEIRPRPTGAPHTLEFGGRVRRGPKNPHRTFKVGDFGPIRESVSTRTGRPTLIWTRLRTPAQVGRATALWKKYCLENTYSFYVAARPFMRPAMLKNMHVVPSFFKYVLLRGK